MSGNANSGARPVIWTEPMLTALHELRAAGEPLDACGFHIGVSETEAMRKARELGLNQRRNRGMQPGYAAKGLTARLLAENATLITQRDAAQEALDAATGALHWCAKDACTSGMSWGGKNIVGDKRSIDYVKAAVHYYEQLDATREAWVQRVKDAEAQRDAAARAGFEREALASAADAARYRYLRDHCSYHAAMTWEQPAEWSIGWEFQQSTPAQACGTFDALIDKDIARQAASDAEADAEANAVEIAPAAIVEGTER